MGPANSPEMSECCCIEGSTAVKRAAMGRWEVKGKRSGKIQKLEITRFYTWCLSGYSNESFSITWLSLTFLFEILNSQSFSKYFETSAVLNLYSKKKMMNEKSCLKHYNDCISINFSDLCGICSSHEFYAESEVSSQTGLILRNVVKNACLFI